MKRYDLWRALSIVLVMATGLVTGTAPAQGGSVFSLPFAEIAENGQTPATDAGFGAQLRLTATDDDDGVIFRLDNGSFLSEPMESVITSFYFDQTSIDPTLNVLEPGDEDSFLGGTSRPEDPQIGFDYVTGGTLPGGGGDNLDPAFDVSFGFEAKSPPAGRGIKEGEWAEFRFDYVSGASFSDLKSAMPNTLRVGLHVLSIDAIDDDSASFVAVPLPAGGWLGLSMLGGMAVIGAIRRRWHRSDHMT